MPTAAPPPRAYAAVDLGATSGRVMLGTVDGGVVRMTEVHRFANGPRASSSPGASPSPGVPLGWDIERLFHETLVGLAAAVLAADTEGRVLAGIGVDSWGVDYTVLDRTVLENSGHDASVPFSGRVDHHRGADPTGPAEAETAVAAARAYAITGIPPHPINTSYRLRAERRAGASGGTVLLVPDLWVFLLTGVVGAERTIASTTQLLDARSGRWSPQLLDGWDLGAFDFPHPIAAGTVAGVTLPSITARIGADAAVPVFRVAEHDTASALAFAEPDAGQLLVSSGSWSLAGVSLASPVLGEEALQAGFTNEGGVGGTTLVLRNLAGMWLLEECARQWSRELGHPRDPIALVQEASTRDDLAAPVFDVGDERLLAPGDMPARIARLCAESGQTPPEGRLGTVRSIVESLAAAYADVALSVARLTGSPVRQVRIVGGGSRNELLCRRTAERTGLPVIAGPAEASAFGNLAVQLVAAGEFPTVAAVYAAGGSAGGGTLRYEPAAASRDAAGASSVGPASRTGLAPPTSDASHTSQAPHASQASQTPHPSPASQAPQAALASLVDLSRQLGRPDRRWAVLAEGNTSVALGDGRMLVKASGASMAIAEASDFVEMDGVEVLRLVDAPAGGASSSAAHDDDAVRALFAVAARGARRPSVEALLHAVCLDIPGVEAVGHTHPVSVNALLCSPRASLLVEGSLFPDQIVVLGTDPLLVPYVDPGLTLARVVRRTLHDRIAETGAAPKVLYLQNHGMFALGADTAEVLRITEMAVKVADVILGSLAAGGPTFLDAADVARIDTRPDELLRRAALRRAATPDLPDPPDPTLDGATPR
ncbi:FGGY-family carbohydrate kinase [Herbiconiux sp. CPCC 205763]|uniref:FGGY-family carbohydrate kinase n=1 Tax=Herbiconiux aconitum TaxID=2970913 RepID=A0ABT2GV21_9MICO|nr:FGGY-family carbohydrate kinase [Herbiconiux aconitum]MCS5720071.1 FGGY-family carbohydrate kinase [Herbiconiux aconitum]